MQCVTSTTYAVRAFRVSIKVQTPAEQEFLPPEPQYGLNSVVAAVAAVNQQSIQMTCASALLCLTTTTKDCRAVTMALMQKLTHLIDVVGRVLFEIHGPPDFEVGLTVQVGGLDEAHLHTHPSHVICITAATRAHNYNQGGPARCQPSQHTWMLLIHGSSPRIINSPLQALLSTMLHLNK